MNRVTYLQDRIEDALSTLSQLGKALSKNSTFKPFNPANRPPLDDADESAIFVAITLISTHALNDLEEVVSLTEVQP